MKNSTLSVFALIGFVATFSYQSNASEISDALATIKNIQGEGLGNESASQAWSVLSKAELSDLPEIIKGLDDASPLAANYLRLATDSIVGQQGTRSELPKETLTQLVMDLDHSSQARELAFEIISVSDSDYSQNMVGLFINDPSLSLRRLAVARKKAEADILLSVSQKDAALSIYQEVLQSARDIDQIESIITELNSLGKKVTVTDTFGFLMDWQIVGPFHNIDRAGFGEIFPPEKNLGIKKSFNGKSGEIKWKSYQSRDTYGKVDINQAVGPVKEVTAYAYREFFSDKDQPAQIRLGCKNAWKIWFNGEYVFGRDEYHRGSRIDQYSFPINLKKGANKILLKVCQNEQTESWTKEWEFQFRICDASGKSIPESKH